MSNELQVKTAKNYKKKKKKKITQNEGGAIYKYMEKFPLWENWLIKVTVNSEIFARILFSRIALKHIFSTLKFATRA